MLPAIAKNGFFGFKDQQEQGLDNNKAPISGLISQRPQARAKKVVIIKSSDTREESHTGFALDIFSAVIQKKFGKTQPVTIREYHLAEFITRLPVRQTLEGLPPEHAALMDDFFDNDLLLIGTSIKNFAPSLLLQAFFHGMRRRLLTFGADGKVVSRNFSGKNIMIVISGVSGMWKWRLLNQFVFFVHFNLLFDFWGNGYDNNILRILFRPQNRIRKLFIPNARAQSLESRKLEIARRVTRFAQKADFIFAGR